MRIKEFFKPTKGKITLLIVLSILMLGYNYPSFIPQCVWHKYTMCENQLLFIFEKAYDFFKPTAILSNLFLFVTHNLLEDSSLTYSQSGKIFFGNLLIALEFLYNYIISCLVIFIFNQVRYKMKNENNKKSHCSCKN